MLDFKIFEIKKDKPAISPQSDRAWKWFNDNPFHFRQGISILFVDDNLSTIVHVLRGLGFTIK